MFKIALLNNRFVSDFVVFFLMEKLKREKCNEKRSNLIGWSFNGKNYQNYDTTSGGYSVYPTLQKPEMRRER